METTARYNYRLRPGAEAERALVAEWHRCRFLWNEAVHQQKTGQKPTFPRLCKLLTEARGRTTWLRDGSVVVQQQTLRTYGKALTDSFKVKGRGRPKFKKRRECRPSLNYTNLGFSIRDDRLRLAGKVNIPVVWSRNLPSEPTSVRVFQDSLGHWYASFVVVVDAEQPPHTGAMLGIDWGVKTVATTTDEAYDLPTTEPGKRAAAKLARYQRMMSRRRGPKNSSPTNGYRNARSKTARVSKKVARQRKDGAVKWANTVVFDHSLIAVEDFKPKFLALSKMARKSADNAVGTAKRELIERGARAGREVVLVPPAYTTMTCGECLSRAKTRLPLSERVFRCEFCGHVADRDRNAARVILATVGLYRADVETVRHSDPPSGVEGMQVESGIPRL